jgi:hypothetical protein
MREREREREREHGVKVKGVPGIRLRMAGKHVK